MQSLVEPDSDPQLQVKCDKENLMTVYFLAAMLLHLMRMQAIAITIGLKRKSTKVSPAFQTEPPSDGYLNLIKLNVVMQSVAEPDSDNQFQVN